MPETQITSFVANPISGTPPFSTWFRGLLSVVTPFAGLPNKTVSIQILNPTNNIWTDTGAVGVTDSNGVFNTEVVWNPQNMPVGTYSIRAYFAGDGTNTASNSAVIQVIMGGGGIPLLWIALGIGGVAAALYLVMRKRG